MTLLTNLSLILFAFLSSTLATDIYVNGTLWKSFNTPSVRLGQHFNITGKLVLANPPSGCPEFKNKDELKGNIAWITSDSGAIPCPFVRRLEELDKLGVIGVVYENKGFGGGFGFGAYFLNFDFKHSSVALQGVESGKVSGIQKILKDDSNNVTIQLESGSNEVTQTQKEWMVFSVIMGIFSLVVLVLAISKWKAFIHSYGFQKSVPQITLFLHVLGAIWRIFAVVDPPFTRGIYPYQVSTFFDITLYPLVLTATLLIGFYWEDAMRLAKVHSIPTLQKMAIPFRISVGFLFGIAFLGVILRVFSTPITVFYTVAASKVLRTLYKSRSLGKRQRALHKMTLLLVGSSICMWLYLLEVIALAASRFTVTRYFILRFLLYGGINLMSLFQISAFQSPTGPGHSSDRTPTTSQMMSWRTETSIHFRSSRDSIEVDDVVELPQAPAPPEQAPQTQTIHEQATASTPEVQPTAV